MSTAAATRCARAKEECIVEFTWLLSREFAPPLLVDAVFAHTLEIGRRGTGQPLHPLRVELKRKPAHREIHKAHYRCRVLIQSDAIQYMGTVTTGNAFTTFGNASAFTTGTTFSAPMVRREGRFFVIKYL